MERVLGLGLSLSLPLGSGRGAVCSARGPAYTGFPVTLISWCLSLSSVVQDQRKKVRAVEMRDNPDSEGTAVSITGIISSGREQDSSSCLAAWILMCWPSSLCRVLSAHCAGLKASSYCLHIIFGSVTYQVFSVLKCKKWGYGNISCHLNTNGWIFRG